jgi:hypothetical protein
VANTIHQKRKIKINNRCPDCGILIDPESIRCKSCARNLKIGIKAPGYKSGKVKCTCGQCGKVFFRFPSDIERGNGQFCCTKCRAKAKGIEQKKKRIKCICKQCEKEFYIKPSEFKNGRGLYCCRKCANKGLDKSKEKNPRWIDGRSFLPYSPEFNEKLKEKIRERDGRVCQYCGKTEEQELTDLGWKLSIHHKDYNKKNCQSDNLVSLCNICNVKMNSNRSEWQQYWKNIEKIRLQSKREGMSIGYLKGRIDQRQLDLFFIGGFCE